MPRSQPDAAMLIVDAALTQLRERGVSATFDRISLEEAITASGVSRATGYRRWPNRYDFLQEVLVRAVRDVRLEPEAQAEFDAVHAILDEHRALLVTEEGRRSVVVESLRVAVAADHQRIVDSREWRDYFALRAICDGITDTRVRQALRSELIAAETAFSSQRAGVYTSLSEILGYRLTPPLDGASGFRIMSEAIGALMTGLATRTPAAEHHPSLRAKAFGSLVEAEWSVATYALVSAVLAYLEPDPAVSWDEERIAASLHRIEKLEQEFAPHISELA